MDKDKKFANISIAYRCRISQTIQDSHWAIVNWNCYTYVVNHNSLSNCLISDSLVLQLSDFVGHFGDPLVSCYILEISQYLQRR